MKEFKLKRVFVILLIVSIGITTVFASNGIKSAVVSNTKVKLNGVSVPLNNPIILVTQDNEKESKMYMPMRELLEYLGYEVIWDGKQEFIYLNSINHIAENVISKEVIGDIGETVITTNGSAFDIKNNPNQFNIAESGSFSGKNNQTLKMEITSTIKGGTVDLFLIDPNNKQYQFTIGSGTATKEIELTEGVWKYNCSGMFRNGGDIRITGTIK